MKHVLGFCADIHSGHQLGLMNPDTQLLDDSGPEIQVRTPQLNSIQHWLWPNYTADMENVFALAGKGGKVTFILDGDITWGAKYPDQLVSARAADQFTIAVANLAPWYEHKALKNTWLVQGTESHEWGAGSAPIAVAQFYSSKLSKVSTKCIQHIRPNVDGVVMDVDHHGPPPGGTVWVDGDALRRYTKNVMLRDLLAGKEPPQVLVRAHYHRGIHETVRVQAGNRTHVCEAFVLPCYCGLTHYARQASRSGAELSCGMVAVVVENGAVASAHEFWRNLDLRTEMVA